MSRGEKESLGSVRRIRNGMSWLDVLFTSAAAAIELPFLMMAMVVSRLSLP